jgi:hypothetical protein
MVFQSRRQRVDNPQQRPFILFITARGRSQQLIARRGNVQPHGAGKISADGRKMVPLRAALPPAVVRGLHTELDGDTDHEAEGGEKDWRSQGDVEAREGQRGTDQGGEEARDCDLRGGCE